MINVEEKGMYNNNLYNLMEQAVEESKSLWRIKNNYLSDSGQDQESRQFWDKLVYEKEKHCEELLGLIATQIQTTKEGHEYQPQDVGQQQTPEFQQGQQQTQEFQPGYQQQEQQF